MLVSAMTYNLGILLLKKLHIEKTFKKYYFSYDYKKCVIYANTYRLNQSGQHNL